MNKSNSKPPRRMWQTSCIKQFKMVKMVLCVNLDIKDKLQDFGLEENLRTNLFDLTAAEELLMIEHFLKGEQSDKLHAGMGGLLDSEMDKLSEDAVLCRVRAKRGCATHPRSIAERVRRTRISDRIRKLQELVPNMDKQTNTADMLEEAVEYVKLLQKQIQELTEQQKKCKCCIKE